MIIEKTIPVSADLVIELVFVEGGTFIMGDNESKFSEEKPAHKVTLPSFFIGKYTVTQDIWQNIMGENPSFFKGEKRPVENVSWLDCQKFIQKINQMTASNFRLPAEAEWEYAAKGGKFSQGFIFSGSDKLSQVAWYESNSDMETRAVGLLLPNELGLYDMSGNVWEWCEDDWHENYMGATLDGSAWVDTPARGARRVLRGGSSFFGAVRCRPAIRDLYSPDDRDGDIGFRLVLPFQFAG